MGYLVSQELNNIIYYINITQKHLTFTGKEKLRSIMWQGEIQILMLFQLRGTLNKSFLPIQTSVLCWALLT